MDVDLVLDVQEMSASDVYVLSDENSDDEEVVMSAEQVQRGLRITRVM